MNYFPFLALSPKLLSHYISLFPGANPRDNSWPFHTWIALPLIYPGRLAFPGDQPPLLWNKGISSKALRVFLKHAPGTPDKGLRGDSVKVWWGDPAGKTNCGVCQGLYSTGIRYSVKGAQVASTFFQGMPMPLLLLVRIISYVLSSCYFNLSYDSIVIVKSILSDYLLNWHVTLEFTAGMSP